MARSLYTSDDTPRTFRRALRYVDVAIVGAALLCGGVALAPSLMSDPSPAPAPTTTVTQVVPLVAPSAVADVATPAQASSPIAEPALEPKPDPEPQPEPQVPVGGSGDLAPGPTSPPPTCDGGCVAPVDLHPVEQPIGPTPANLQLLGNDSAGCSLDCITRAQVFTAASTTNLVMEVETSTPATLKVWVADEEPTLTNSGHPYFPGLQPVGQTSGDLDLFFTTEATDLDEETEYWVLVIARDEQGRISEFVGSVVTPRINDDIELAFAAIDVIYDGDKGRNKGELTFDWNVGYDEVGRNGEYKRSDGSRIDLSDQINSYGRLDLSDGELPLLQVRSLERDPKTARFCNGGDEVGGYGTNDNCGYAWNSTLPVAFTIADVGAMASCDVFDIDARYDGWRCTRVATTESHSGIPEFSVVVAFRVF